MQSSELAANQVGAPGGFSVTLHIRPNAVHAGLSTLSTAGRPTIVQWFGLTSDMSERSIAANSQLPSRKRRGPAACRRPCLGTSSYTLFRMLRLLFQDFVRTASTMSWARWPVFQTAKPSPTKPKSRHHLEVLLRNTKLALVHLNDSCTTHAGSNKSLIEHSSFLIEQA